MAKISGHGAECLITDAETDITIGTQSNTNFEIDPVVRTDEATDSESTSEDGEAIISAVESWTIEAIDKDDTSPELVGLTIGARVNVYFRRGTTTNYDWVTGTLVTGHRITNPQMGLRRIVITGKYGTYTPNTAI